MIQSMTGYGKCVVEYNGKKIHAEVKSLNSKALDITARIAPIYREKEMEMRQMMQQKLERGKVEFVLWIEKDDASVVAPLNMTLLHSYKLQIEQMQQEKVLVIGENIKIRRFARYDTGLNIPYVHMGGRIGVIVNMEVSAGLEGKAEVIELGKDIAMQIAAMNPSFRDKSDVDDATIAKEKEILTIQAKEDPKNAGKPENILEKMVMGRISKYYEENCLLQQAFVKGDKISVEKHVAEVAKAVGGEIKVLSFTRFEKGEGIEKKQDDFAAEIASMVK